MNEKLRAQLLGGGLLLAALGIVAPLAAAPELRLHPSYLTAAALGVLALGLMVVAIFVLAYVLINPHPRISKQRLLGRRPALMLSLALLAAAVIAVGAVRRSQRADSTSIGLQSRANR